MPASPSPYNFSVGSDDGSFLYVNGAQLIDGHGETCPYIGSQCTIQYLPEVHCESPGTWEHVNARCTHAGSFCFQQSFVCGKLTPIRLFM